MTGVIRYSFTICVAVTIAGCGANLAGATAGAPENTARDSSRRLDRRPTLGKPQVLFTVLYNFRGNSDGAQPQGGLIFDASDALYGTTEFGGSFYACGFYGNQGCGTVFKLTPTQSGYAESVIYSFRGHRSNGAWPWDGLAIDRDGALYGTTSSVEGARGCGTVFKLTPVGTRYTESLIYRFPRPDCIRGATPYSGLILGNDGALYGTTFLGGFAGEGNAFKLKLSRSGYTERFTYNFDGLSGAQPFAGLTFGKHGALYGTTRSGGAMSKCGFYDNGCGVVFKFTPMGRSYYTESVIHSFDESDGEQPFGGVVFDTKGALYGTTAEGGSGVCSGFTGCGVVFKLTPSRSGYTERVLYNFAGYSHSDGQDPMGTLVFDKKGALYGTTYRGGTPSCSCGTIFKLTPSGSGYSESVLHSFTGSDGAEPRAGLTIDKKGDLYGTTSAGGNSGDGTVFELTP